MASDPDPARALIASTPEETLLDMIGKYVAATRMLLIWSMKVRQDPGLVLAPQAKEAHAWLSSEECERVRLLYDACPKVTPESERKPFRDMSPQELEAAVLGEAEVVKQWVKETAALEDA